MDSTEIGKGKRTALGDGSGEKREPDCRLSVTLTPQVDGAMEYWAEGDERFLSVQ